MKSRKLEVLIETYKELSEEFGKFHSPDLDKIIEGWSVSLEQVNEWLSDPECPVKSSQIVPGFEQGLRELPSLLFDLPEKVRLPATQVTRQVINEHLPEFYEQQDALLESIVSKGKIKNGNDWFVVRARMDDIEGLPKYEKEFELLDGILLAFEQSV